MKSSVEIDIETENKKLVDLRYLFLTFLKIGLVSFGGHMALIAVIQREMVDKDKTVDADVIIDGISIASLLPGPVAVNVVAYIGYHLQGKKGAAISMLGILLPACTLMFVISWCYFNFAYKVHLADIMVYTAGAVSAIILSTGANIYKKEIHGKALKTLICLAAIAITIFAKGYFITLGLMMAGGLLGYFINPDNKSKLKVVDALSPAGNFRLSWLSRLLLAILGIIELGFLTNSAAWISNIYLKLISVFSGISLSLFGGGYVIVPIMQSLIVGDLKWLNSQQFVDSITFSQVTPGPILISALFVGYKLAGFLGGLIAVAAIFIPSATLMLIVSNVFKRNKKHLAMQRILAGIKPVVVGMIIASAAILLRSLVLDKAIVAVAVVAFVLSFRFKVSPVYLILGAICLGFIFS
ncbi:chromate efflux transporter [Mucilaginibacter sp. FT3.2]|uniref:chromate efflux transporter n=1 Tax=Mucilaginibacter sp. FT3.2 TaxID=2723090 RepID=UPI0016111BCB|nr:chromate efflux transporter [Mucilaginibacter sp. FT3.2]MBB6229808.1 chromate transporter [Mucilaginibacter sp. FT3.2]